jgi:hypothetical protein
LASIFDEQVVRPSRITMLSLIAITAPASVPGSRPAFTAASISSPLARAASA